MAKSITMEIIIPTKSCLLILTLFAMANLFEVTRSLSARPSCATQLSAANQACSTVFPEAFSPSLVATSGSKHDRSSILDDDDDDDDEDDDDDDDEEDDNDGGGSGSNRGKHDHGSRHDHDDDDDDDDDEEGDNDGGDGGGKGTNGSKDDHGSSRHATGGSKHDHSSKHGTNGSKYDHSSKHRNNGSKHDHSSRNDHAHDDDDGDDDDEDGDGGDDDDDHHHHHRHGKHKHKVRRKNSPENEQCCRWLTDVDNDCMCEVLRELPDFVAKITQTMTLKVGRSCEFSFHCN